MRAAVILGVCVLACSAQSESLAAFHVGNSISDQLDGIPSIAESKGDQVDLGRKSIPGAGIGYNYNHGGITDEMRNGTWDIVLTLAFANGSDLGVNADARYIGYYYDAGLATNPACRLIVFTQWPSTDEGDYQTVWNRPLDTTDAGYAQPYGSAEYHETLVSVIRQAYPGNEVHLFPIGHVLYEFDRRARAGNIPGYTSAHELYADGIHLNSEGKYLQNLTAYAVYFGKNPRDAGLTFYQWSGDETVSREFADTAADIAWDVVTDMSDWTGVEPTSETVSRTCGVPRTVSVIPTGSEHVSLNGRLTRSSRSATMRSLGITVDMSSKKTFAGRLSGE